MSDLQQRLASAALAQVPRLLSTLDREADSESFGSFDRDYWAWKLRDFPVTMLQYGLVPLARLHRGAIPRTRYEESDRLARWIEAAVRRVLSSQRRDGGFDSVAPNAPDHGVTVAMAYALVEAAPVVASALGPALDDAIRRAVEYGLRSREDYAFISNHQALAALGFRRAGEHLADERFLRRSDAIVDAILAHQSPDGPFAEYGGADPGYETLGLFYLALLFRSNGSEELLAAMRRSVHFLAHCVHPDGSVGGVYGSRHTHVFHPGGLALLAEQVPEAGAILAFVGQRLGEHPVVTLDAVDALNLPVLLHGYVEAATAADPNRAVPALPCEALRGRIDFPDVGIRVVGNEAYFAVVSSARGGVGRFHARDGRLLHQDAGWLLREGRVRWTSQRLGLADAVDPASDTPDTLTCRTSFARVDLPLPTPVRFLLLRLANLTVFRWPRAAAAIRAWIVGRLVTRMEKGPHRLERKFRFGPAEVEILDRVVSTSPRALTSAQLVREFTSIHMGSARYFHPSELDVTVAGDAGTLHLELVRNGEVTHRTRFGPGLVPGRDPGSGDGEAPRGQDRAATPPEIQK